MSRVFHIEGNCHRCKEMIVIADSFTAAEKKAQERHYTHSYSIRYLHNGKTQIISTRSEEKHRWENLVAPNPLIIEDTYVDFESREVLNIASSGIHLYAVDFFDQNSLPIRANNIQGVQEIVKYPIKVIALIPKTIIWPEEEFPLEDLPYPLSEEDVAKAATMRSAAKATAEIEEADKGILSTKGNPFR